MRVSSSFHLAAGALLLATASIPVCKADAIAWTEFNAAGGFVEGGVLPSLCPNPLPQTFSCGPDPFSVTTTDGNFTLAGSDTVTNILGLAQFLDVQVRATDNTGANGSILIDVNQTYAFSGIFTSYTAFDFMSGFFGPAPLPNAGTNVISTLIVDGAVTLPLLGATAGDADALGFNRGPGFAIFPTPPLAGVTFDGQALFNFKSANQLPGDFIDLPFGISDAPEPGAFMMLGSGLIGLIGFRRYRQP